MAFASTVISKKLYFAKSCVILILVFAGINFREYYFSRIFGYFAETNFREFCQFARKLIFAKINDNKPPKT